VWHSPVSIEIGRLGASVVVVAEAGALCLRATGLDFTLEERRRWPRDALRAPGGLTTAIEVEQLLEQGLALSDANGISVPYPAFEDIERLGLRFARRWAEQSPFEIHIDRVSDLGRPDFEYLLTFVDGTRPVSLERTGAIVQQPADSRFYLLSPNAYALLETAESFNRSPSEARKSQAWQVFGRVKELARAAGAHLEPLLEANEVHRPSAIQVRLHDDGSGSESFEPDCPGVAAGAFAAAFRRNREAERIYSLDLPGGGRSRLLLTGEQQEVLRRMKRGQRMVGELASQARKDPSAFFDGVLDAVDIQYGPRVAGIGAFEFAPVPQRPSEESTPLGELFAAQASAPAVGPFATLVAETPAGGICRIPFDNEQEREDFKNLVKEAEARCQSTVTVKGVEILLAGILAALGDEARSSGTRTAAAGAYLLIHTNEEAAQRFGPEVVDVARVDAAFGSGWSRLPTALLDRSMVKPHQVAGIAWLEQCCRIGSRRGVLLADDMGLGKTLQILAFIAQGIEDGLFPDLCGAAAPWRPVLVVVPLILLENRTWQEDMTRFFEREGEIFQPVLSLHGSELSRMRLDKMGREIEVGRPILNLEEIQRNRVVITTYETVKNYQHSFASRWGGKALWSLVVSDEAQEYKTPSTKISHAMKALEADFHIASSGTPVENRLLDLWNIFDTLQPPLLGSARDFVEKYESPGDSPDHDRSMRQSLRDRLLMDRPDAFLLRREKEGTVGLPPKTQHVLDCPMGSDELRLHSEIVASTKESESPAHVLSALHRLSLLYQHPLLLDARVDGRSASDWMSGSSKLRAVVSELKRIHLKGEKAIIFARHIAAQQMLALCLSEEFGVDVRIVNGQTAAGGGGKARQKILQDFRTRPGFSTVILSPFVAGVGLNLVEANHVFHYGRWWNPAVESQATDRVYRLGQAREVHVYLPILRDTSGTLGRTFDEAVHGIIEQKQGLAKDVLTPLPTENEIRRDLLDALTA
jgi:hypothetical protein